MTTAERNYADHLGNHNKLYLEYVLYGQHASLVIPHVNNCRSCKCKLTALKNVWDKFKNPHNVDAFVKLSELLGE